MKKVRKFERPSSPLVVIATALCMIAIIFIAGSISGRRNRINAVVEIDDPLVETVASQPKIASSPLILPDGEVERTAVRVREVSALVMGLTLLAVNEAIAQGPPSGVGALIDRFLARGLLPPGIRLHSAKGVLESDRAVIYVRYRPEPPALEVVSIGREPINGPPIIGRIATGTDEKAGAALFIARQINEVALPEPFAPVMQVEAMNWSVEPLRERSLSPQELEQLNHWLQAYNFRK